MPREMPYVSDYEEFRRVDERDREMRADVKRDRAEEMGHPYPRPGRRPFTIQVAPDCEICAYCGETARRCECWT